MLIKSKTAWAVIGCAIVAFSQASWATSYYVGTQASKDSASGTQAEPWKTLHQVNAARLQPGDKVMFARGGSWEGTLRLQTGVAYGSYGSGAKPIIRGSTDVGNLKWQKCAPSLGRLDPADLRSVANDTDVAECDRSLDLRHVYVADVKSVVNDTDASGRPVLSSIGHLYLNGNRLQRARYPNLGAGKYSRGKNRFLMVNATSQERGSGALLIGKDNVPAIGRNKVPADERQLEGAQVFAKPNNYSLYEYTVTAFDANQAALTLARPKAKNEPPDDFEAGFGYWLENKLWMLDQPGEWFYDEQEKKLYVRMPNDSKPTGQSLFAAVRAHGVNGSNIDSVDLSDLSILETLGSGVVISAARRVHISGIDVLRAGGDGIAISNSKDDSDDAPHGVISGVTVSDSLARGIGLGPTTKNIDVVNSTIRNAGLGYFAWAALELGRDSRAKGNTIEGSSYHGIRGFIGNVIDGNVVKNSCMEFDDCGAIYMWAGSQYGLVSGAYDLKITVSNNFIDGAPLAAAPDRLDGVSNSRDNLSATSGIYLDDFSSAVKLDGNYVTGADYGILLHIARNNTVTNNRVIGNARAEIFLEEGGNQAKACPKKKACDPRNFMVGNTFTNNVIASTLPHALILQRTPYDSTSDFATFTGNQYAMYADSSLVPLAFVQDEHSKASSRTNKTFKQWNASADHDVPSSGSKIHSVAAGVGQPSAGANMISNGNFEKSLVGWSKYQAAWSLKATECPSVPVQCLSARPDASLLSSTPSDQNPQFIIISPPNMSVQAGKRYVLSFDARADQDGASLDMVIRQNDAPWADQSNYAPGITLKKSWQRHKRVLTATQNRANTARLDFIFHSKGAVYLGNASLREVPVFNNRAAPVGFYNAGTSSKTFNCPSSVDASLCTSYVDVKTGASVSFPITLGPKTSKVLVMTAPQWSDPDHDGVPGDGAPGGLDQCPGTPDAQMVDERGCGS